MRIREVKNKGVFFFLLWHSFVRDETDLGRLLPLSGSAVLAPVLVAVAEPDEAPGVAATAVVAPHLHAGSEHHGQQRTETGLKKDKSNG